MALREGTGTLLLFPIPWKLLVLCSHSSDEDLSHETQLLTKDQQTALRPTVKGAPLFTWITQEYHFQPSSGLPLITPQSCEKVITHIQQTAALTAWSGKLWLIHWYMGQPFQGGMPFWLIEAYSKYSLPHLLVLDEEPLYVHSCVL